MAGNQSTSVVSDILRLWTKNGYVMRRERCEMVEDRTPYIPQGVAAWGVILNKELCNFISKQMRIQYNNHTISSHFAEPGTL
jgi:hypothetical protein